MRKKPSTSYPFRFFQRWKLKHSKISPKGSKIQNIVGISVSTNLFSDFNGIIKILPLLHIYLSYNVF